MAMIINNFNNYYFSTAPVVENEQGYSYPELENGEKYAGIILDEETGSPLHHLILLPGEAAEVNWQQALDWAKEQGGELPTRREQSLLFANLKSQFKPKYYWSSERTRCATAWLQDFTSGYQFTSGKGYDGFARAVRRSPICEQHREELR